MEFGNYPNILSLKDMVKALGREWGNWAEPADCLNIFSEAIAFKVGNETRLCRYTSPDQYWDLTLEELIEKIKTNSQSNYSYIIDDGSYAYAIVSITGIPHLIDPHVYEGVKILEAVPFD